MEAGIVGAVSASCDSAAAGKWGPPPRFARSIRALLLAQLVDEPDHLDDGLVGLVVDLHERKLLALVDLVEGGGILGMDFEHGLLDRRLQILRQGREIGHW